MTQDMISLGFDRIIEQLKEQAVSRAARRLLEELLRRGCFFLVTTHDPQIKQWAEQTERVISARMAFDRASLMPLYRLELGKSGRSCAIEIAHRLGLDEGLLDRARQVTAHGPGAVPEARRKHMHVPATRLQRMEKKLKAALSVSAWATASCCCRTKRTPSYTGPRMMKAMSRSGCRDGN